MPLDQEAATPPPVPEEPGVGQTAAQGDQRLVSPDAAVPGEGTTATGADLIWALNPPASAKAARQMLRQQRDASNRLDVNLRRLIGYFAFFATVVELILANVLFVYYVWWRPEHEGAPAASPMVVAVWYCAIVVQLVGMLFVATRCCSRRL
jgi:hypothetical protein